MPDMTESEKVHFLTEGVYRNILDNYNPGVRQLISSGRSYQKALHNVATAAKSYIDSIYNLAQSAQVCKGATSEIGAAMLQIAETHKEINTQVIDNIKSFHAELLIPLETKQENEFKQITLIHKKYNAGHKYHLQPVDKAQSALKKHKKKNKAAKYGFDQKEMQISREVKELQAKLDDYRMNNLRTALLEERKRYCFVLDRVCSMVRIYASHHSKAHELLTHRLTEWSDLTKNAHLLPPQTEAIIRTFKAQLGHDEVYNNPDDMNDMDYGVQNSGPDNNSLTYGTSSPPSLTYGTNPNHDPLYASRDDYAGRQPIPVPPPTIPYPSHALKNTPTQPKRPNSVCAFFPGARAFKYSPVLSRSRICTLPTMPNGSSSSDTEHAEESGRMGGIMVPNPPPQTRQHVRALYTHTANTDTQLSFMEGDMIALIGEKRDGWHYGENLKSHRMGWFPVAFTQPVELTFGHQRVRSLGTLNDLAHYTQNGPTTPTGHQGPPGQGYQEQDGGMSTLQRSHTITERPISMYSNHQSMANVMATPTRMQKEYRTVTWAEGLNTRLTDRPLPLTPDMTSNSGSSHSYQYPTGSVPDINMLNPRHEPAPPPTTPPPPPPPPPVNHPGSRNHQHQFNHQMSSPNIRGPDPLYDRAGTRSLGEYTSQNHNHNLIHNDQMMMPPGGGGYGMTSPSPPQSSSGYSGSSNRANPSSNSSHGSLHYGNHGSGPGGYQHPPPPPNLPAPPPPTSDYEDDTPRNNPFANVTLKRTATNDRSSPRIN